MKAGRSSPLSWQLFLSASGKATYPTKIPQKYLYYTRFEHEPFKKLSVMQKKENKKGP